MGTYKIGYTTGAFDMFHIGHLNILRAAKARCDYLVVGVSTDAVVESYKNKKTIIPFEERIEIVRALKCVDEVVPQVTMNKMDAWHALHFHALFHGSDWKDSEMYNRLTEDFSAVGVDVVFLPYTDGVSSTILADKLYSIEDEST